MECHGERLMECHEDRERLMECHDDRKRRTQALDKPRHHTAEDGVFGASRGETDALANSDAGERVQLNSSRQPTGVNTNRWMILMKRSQKSGPTAGGRADPQRVEERTYSW